MSGIPDPGGVSGTFSALARTAANGSPFDLIRMVMLDGSERWSARELMPLLGYDRWENFAAAIDRAMAAATVQGYGADDLFRSVTKKGAGRPQQDYELARFACYLVAMNGDPRKAEVAAAQSYFAIRTRQAETTPARALTEDEIVHQALSITTRRVEELTARVAELEPSAEAWDRLAEVGADYEVGDAAKILSRDPKISIGRNRLFEFMRERGWIYRGRHNAWKAYQDQVDNGRLKQRPGREYFCKRHNEYRTGDPTIVVTPKGLAELRRLLGGSGQLELVAAS